MGPPGLDVVVVVVVVGVVGWVEVDVGLWPVGR